MNTTVILAFLSISFFGFLLFWWFYHNANSEQKSSKKYLLNQLQDSTNTREQINKLQLQISKLSQTKDKASPFKITMLAAVFTIPFSFYFYSLLGHPEASNYSNDTTPQQTQMSQEPQMSMEEAIKQLEENLAKNPDDIDGQMLYARSQVSLKNYKKAVIAYRKANELAPNESVILTELAESIAIFNNNKSFLGEPEQLLAKAVELEPNNQKALWLLGMTFYEHKNFAKTNELWTNLYGLMTNVGAKKQLAEQLNDIRTRLGLEVIENSSQTNDQLPSTEISIKINIKEDLIKTIKGKSSLLYLYSKAVEGMPMPIAVIKEPIDNTLDFFPITLSLSDINNLQPNRKLSSFKSIKIGVRISFSGNAIAQAGDLQSEEQVINLPYSDTVELTIDKIIE